MWRPLRPCWTAFCITATCSSVARGVGEPRWLWRLPATRSEPGQQRFHSFSKFQSQIILDKTKTKKSKNLPKMENQKQKHPTVEALTPSRWSDPGDPNT